MAVTTEAQAQRGRINPAFRRAALEVGKQAGRTAAIFLATEAFLGAAELFTDARVFAGTLAMSQARDMWTPLDGIVGGALTAIQVGGLAYVDHESRVGLQQHSREVSRIYHTQAKGPFDAAMRELYLRYGEGFFKHGGTIASIALPSLWAMMAGGMFALALAQ